VLELDFGINRDGVVDPVHVERYNEFGDWIRSCYDTPVAASTSTPPGGAGAGSAGSAGNAGSAGSSTIAIGSQTIQLPHPTVVDRTVLREDLSRGQRVRGYVIEAEVDGAWVRFVQVHLWQYVTVR